MTDNDLSVNQDAIADKLTQGRPQLLKFVAKRE
jgi:hypothetical protein